MLFQVAADIVAADDSYVSTEMHMSVIVEAVSLAQVHEWAQMTWLTQWPKSTTILGWTIAVYEPVNLIEGRSAYSGVVWDSNDPRTWSEDQRYAFDAFMEV